MTKPQRIDDGLPAEGETMFRGALIGDYLIDDQTGCWNWQRGLTHRGYPSNKAHRLYYKRAHGDLVKGMHIHHKCDNPACVNPEHLEAIAPVDHFIEHHLTRRGMTLDTIREIRQEGRTPGVTLLATAKKYDIGTSTVQFYWDDRRWSSQLNDGPVIRPDLVCCEKHQTRYNARRLRAERKVATALAEEQ